MLSVRQKDFSLEIKIFLSTFSFSHYHEIGVKSRTASFFEQATDGQHVRGGKNGRKDETGKSPRAFTLFFTWSF